MCAWGLFMCGNELNCALQPLLCAEGFLCPGGVVENVSLSLDLWLLQPEMFQASPSRSVRNSGNIVRSGLLYVRLGLIYVRKRVKLCAEGRAFAK